MAFVLCCEPLVSVSLSHVWRAEMGKQMYFCKPFIPNSPTTIFSSCLQTISFCSKD